MKLYAALLDALLPLEEKLIEMFEAAASS